MPTQKIGRDAKTGRIIPVKEAQRRPNTTTVETVKTPQEVRPCGGEAARHDDGDEAWSRCLVPV